MPRSTCPSPRCWYPPDGAPQASVLLRPAAHLDGAAPVPDEPPGLDPRPLPRGEGELGPVRPHQDGAVGGAPVDEPEPVAAALLPEGQVDAGDRAVGVVDRDEVPQTGLVVRGPADDAVALDEDALARVEEQHQSGR